jgi:ABC-type nickel/cobalt efflux system permease component RcnA
MDWLLTIQRWLYGGIADGMRAAADPAGLALLVAVAFLFGIVHAFMPGHGKSILVSYHLGRPGRLIEGVATGSLLATTHVASAVVLVLAGVAVISRSVAAGGRTPAFETASAALITLIGAYLVWRSMRPVPYGPHHDGRMLAIVTGLVPCPLTTFILTYALAVNKLAQGLAAVAGMLAGVIVTIASFAIAAILARERLVDMLARTERLRHTLGRGLEALGALAVLALGLAMLAAQLARA